MWSVVIISTKISLFFDEFIDDDFEKKVKGRGSVIRLYANIRFENKKGEYTKPFSAIVDTGAFVSIIPFFIWNECNVKILSKHKMQGLIPKEECSMDVLIGELVGVLVDEKNHTKKYSSMYYLAYTNDIPLILGFRDLLEKFSLYFDYENKIAFIDEK